MAVFVVKCSDVNIAENYKALHFFIDTAARLKSENLMRNPFVGEAVHLREEGAGVWLVDMTPIYPPIYWYSAFAYGAGIMFSFLNIGVGAFISWFVGTALLLLRVFWSKSFYAFMLKQGLKKAGYTGAVTVCGPDEGLRVVTECLKEMSMSSSKLSETVGIASIPLAKY